MSLLLSYRLLVGMACFLWLGWGLGQSWGGRGGGVLFRGWARHEPQERQERHEPQERHESPEPQELHEPQERHERQDPGERKGGEGEGRGGRQGQR